MTTLFISHSSKDTAWAEQMREKLREQGYSSLFLDAHPDDGIHVGADWEQALYQCLRRCRGVIVLCTARWLASPWCVAEAILARERGKRVFLLATAEVTDDRQVKDTGDDAAARIPDFLKDTQFISLAGLTEEEAHARLWRGLAKEGLKDDFPLPKRPYPGLEPFQETDAAVFFGRDGEIEGVIGVLNKRRRHNAEGFILVLGASGCGKSSLVRAGVLPRLRRAGDDGAAAERWIIPPPFAAGRGQDGLATSLALAFKAAGQPRQPMAIRPRLDAAGDLRALADELQVARNRPESNLLLVLDQLEEVFGPEAGSEAKAMLRLLLEASADAASPVVILATMRSDFLNAFQLFPGAAERYEKVTLDPMPSARFGEIIEGPAARFDLHLDPGLGKRLVDDTAHDDALPLLAFTLEQLYAKCAALGTLTQRAYDELGGVSAAIQNAANAILRDEQYAGLPVEDARMRDLRRAFYRLARVGEEGQFTRRQARWSRMPSSCAEVLRRFVQDRLLVSAADDNGEATLTVAHEALFRVWDTLSHWLLRDRKALSLRARIEDAAAEWREAKRAESRAWPEERILDAVREIENSGVSLDDVEDQATVDAFLGPTDPGELERLPALGAAEDAETGGGRYGDAWRLPLSHEARASTGVRLALLGDPRRGVGLRADGLPDLDWCRIEGGQVTLLIRADPDDPNSEIVERPTRAVGPFWMARYPVTVAQFQAFLTDCHRNGRWRLPPGFALDVPDDYPPPKHRVRHGNHPADSVNWLDAALFCHWLSARSGDEVRLPTEDEWQLAATGGDSTRTYPWGPHWDPQREPWRANTIESELNRSTAIGLYPAGAAPAGVLDLAGTVWEWCQNAFDDPDDETFPTQEEDRRVLRGGSWVDYQDFARAASRFRNRPGYRSDFVGFRVVCSSPSLDTER